MPAYQSSLYRHALWIMLIGLISGFFLAFNLVGQIALSPLPGLDIQVPGTPERWRAAHIGSLLNGVMLLALATVLPKFDLTDDVNGKIRLGLILTVWGNAVFYFFAILAPNRGLSLGDNIQGPGNWAGPISYLGGVVAAIALIAVVIVMLRGLKDK